MKNKLIGTQGRDIQTYRSDMLLAYGGFTECSQMLPMIVYLHWKCLRDTYI